MTPFGTLPDGRAVHSITLAEGDLTVRLLTLGATLNDVRLQGVPHSLTLRSDDPADYLGPMLYFGGIVGPVANRMRGAQARIGGFVHNFEANQSGRHILHSASAGTHLKIWEVTEETPTAATFALTLPDGEGGFPGTRRLTARFTVAAPATLRLDLQMTTDATTIANVVNHSYWNLDGTPTWEGHSLRIAADAILPVDADVIPTGEVLPVAGTPYDFRSARTFAPGTPALDHNFCLSDAPMGLRDVLTLTGRSGVSMTIATTEPGVQVYDGGHTRRPGGQLHEGFAIEPQHWPDTPANPHFPPITLLPGETLHTTTEWRFTRA
jgi:aldose 1-epimerase